MNAAFITGINGQDGSYLSELLLEKNYYVYGILRRMSLINTKRIDHIIGNNRFKYSYGDVTDATCLYRNIEKIIKKHSSIEIYHLAAQSHVQISFEMPEYTNEVNANGTLKLLEVCRSIKETYKLNKDQIKIYIACTSELFGDVLETQQTETTPFNPCSPYAVSKLYTYYIAKNYRDSYDMFICSGILFNHESPRRGHNFVTRKITLGLAKILNKEAEFIELGNINSVRDWGHAKDYVNAMHLMLTHLEPGDYVVATNETHTVREFIEKAFAEKDILIKWVGESIDEVGVDQNNVIRIRINSKYFRPTEVKYLHGNPAKIKTILGWEQKIQFDELVKEMVECDCKKYISSL
jgi:GDPmannose 4,6-dehydratase